MIRPGDVMPRADTTSELMVAVLSNSMHLQARTGRVVCCPYVPGTVADDTLPLVVPVPDPPGTLLPELVQWLPVSALGDPFGNVGPAALEQATAIVGALITS
ncbi:hypothetical protein AB0M47_35440 [Hamadaea sp. NPDC051192]|uniref:hypothetical protein n=1 Tax=Hamadaea sp. NPDC051192 TaxID=3154940 RepID=UPI00343901E6